MSAPRNKTTKSFVVRVLDGEARLDSFPAEVRAWQAGDQKRPLHEALGLDAEELLLVAKSPDALRYLLNSRRFGGTRPSVGMLDTQARVNAYAMQLASEHVDLHVLAEVEEWKANLLRQSGSGVDDREPSHA